MLLLAYITAFAADDQKDAVTMIGVGIILELLREAAAWFRWRRLKGEVRAKTTPARRGAKATPEK